MNDFNKTRDDHRTVRENAMSDNKTNKGKNRSPYILINREPSSSITPSRGIALPLWLLFPGTLPAHAGLLSHFPSLGCPAVSFSRKFSRVEAPWPMVELCHLPRVKYMAECEVGVRLLIVFMFY